jgi:hypothetical protein
MSANQFDELAKALATGASRRAVLKAVLMGAATGALTLVSAPRVDAAPGGCKAIGGHCKENAQCCTGRCSPSTSRCCVGSGGTPGTTKEGNIDQDSCCSNGVFCTGGTCTCI